MKPQPWMVRLGWLALLCAVISEASVWAREYYHDREYRGIVIQVDLRNNAFKLDHSDDHKIKLLHWNHKTVFRFPDRSAKLKDLKVNARVRVYFRDEAPLSGLHKAIVNKVVINPTSDPNSPEYNK